MKKTIKILFSVITLFLLLNTGYSQTNEIKIKFIGNCGLYMTDGNINIYVDFPYKSGAFNYMEFDKAELDSIMENSIFLFTHKHPDHYSSKNMRKTLRKKNGRKYGKWNISELKQLSDTIPDFTVRPIETEHSLSFKHYSYLITWYGKRIYFYGDTETTDTILTIKNLDWAFIPYWTAIELNKNNLNIDAKMIGVYHFYPIMKNTNSNPDKIKLLDKQGEIFSIPY